MKSTRVIITMSEREKRWLRSFGAHRGISVAAAIRQAIACLKSTQGQTTYRELVLDTRGIWKQGEALRYQEAFRSEWGKR